MAEQQIFWMVMAGKRRTGSHSGSCISDLALGCNHLRHTNETSFSHLESRKYGPLHIDICIKLGGNSQAVKQTSQKSENV